MTLEQLLARQNAGMIGPQPLRGATLPAFGPPPVPQFAPTRLQNALDGFSRAIEPLQFLQQLGFGTAVGLRSGDWDHFKTTLTQAPAFAPFGARPTIMTGTDVARVLGIDDENAQRWTGLALDLFADPLMAGIVVRSVGKIVRTAGAAGTGNRLVQLGDKLDETISLKTAVDATNRGLGVVGLRPKEFVESFVGKLLDTPIRIQAWRRPLKMRAFEREGEVIEEFATLGEAVLGRYVPRAKGAAPVEELGTRMIGGREHGIGIIDWAQGMPAAMQRRVHDLMEKADNTFRQFDRGEGNVYNQLNAISGWFLDKIDGMASKPALEVFKAINRGDPIEALTPIAATALQTAKSRREMLDKIRAVAEQVPNPTIGGRPATVDEIAGEMTKAVDSLMAESYATVASVGRHLSGYDDFLQLLDDVVANPLVAAGATGGVRLTRADALHHFWQKAQGKQSILDMTPMPNVPGKMVGEALESAYKSQYRVGARENKYTLLRFNMLGPTSYLKGLNYGYLRRMWGTHQNPERIAHAIESRMMLPFKEIQPEHFKTEFAKAFGAAAGEAVDALMRGSVTGRVLTADVVEALGTAGVRAKPDEVYNVLRAVDPDLQMIDETLQAIDRTRKGVKEFTYDMYSRDLRTFQARKDISDDEAAALVQIVGLREQLAGYAKAAAPGMRSFEYMTRAFNDAVDLGLVISRSDAVALGVREGQPRAIINGVDMMLIGSDGKRWGGFADKYIPTILAREIGRVAVIPPTQRASAWQDWLTKVRRAFLSPLPTTIRNMLGNLAVLNTAGVPINELALYLGKARKALENPAVLGEGQYVLHFLRDGTLTRHIGTTMDEHFDHIIEAATKGRTPMQRLVHYLETKVDDPIRSKLDDVMAGAGAVWGGGIARPTESPLLGGFLQQFQYVEDITRAAVFLWSHDKLKKAGMAADEILRRSAHLANNAIYDYTSVGLAVDGLRRSGLSLFPAFAYFTTGRVARVIYERPAVLAAQERFTIAANQLLIPDPDERRSVDALLDDYWAMEFKPVVIPLGEGQYRVLPTNYLIPHVLVSAGDKEQMMWDMFAGGVFRPFLDIIHAWQGGPRGQEPGRPSPVTQRFVREIFAPHEAGTGAAVTGTAQFLGQAYLPGTWARTIAPLMYRYFSIDRERMEYLQEAQVRYFNMEPDQIASRIGGFPTYQVGGRVTLGQQMAAIRKDENFHVASLRQKIQAAMIRGNIEEMQRYALELQQVRQEFAQRRQHVTAGFVGTMRER